MLYNKSRAWMLGDCVIASLQQVTPTCYLCSGTPPTDADVRSMNSSTFVTPYSLGSYSWSGAAYQRSSDASDRSVWTMATLPTAMRSFRLSKVGTIGWAALVYSSSIFYVLGVGLLSGGVINLSKLTVAATSEVISMTSFSLCTWR